MDIMVTSELCLRTIQYDIVWEVDGFYNQSIKYITYEEVININDATTSERSIQAEKSIGSTMGTGAS
jgi:hypothetical protein